MFETKIILSVVEKSELVVERAKRQTIDNHIFSVYI
jgi:hypothetical protein